MLTPHDRIHGQFSARRAPAEDLPDPLVLILFEAQFRPRLLGASVGCSEFYGVEVTGHAFAPIKDPRTEVNSPRPSRLGPVSGSDSVLGMRHQPTTLPASFATPAISRREPLGLTSR